VSDLRKVVAALDRAARSLQRSGDIEEADAISEVYRSLRFKVDRPTYSVEHSRRGWSHREVETARPIHSIEEAKQVALHFSRAWETKTTVTLHGAMIKDKSGGFSVDPSRPFRMVGWYTIPRGPRGKPKGEPVWHDAP